MVLGLLAELSASCGETVNYDTEEKAAAALILPNAAASDNAVGSNPSIDSDSNAPGSSDPLANGNGTNEGNNANTVGNEVPAACFTRTMQVKQDTLLFPEIPQGTTCSFGSNGNLSRKDGFFRAYLRQTQVVSLPEGAILCGITLDHQPAAMRYDDEMFFSVNNKLLLATKDYSEIFPKTDFFLSFSWDNLVNKTYDSLDERKVFCAGAEEGISSCVVPATETQGNIEMKFSEQMNAQLSQALRADKDLTFEWITTGDNDNSDCRHTEIDLGLELRYVMP